MKGVARSYVWWPGMDADIESCTKTCESCQLVKRNPTNAPVHPWISSSRLGERVHIDYAGPVEGKMLLIVVDFYSKWPEVVIQNSTTSEATVNAPRTIFSRGGIPQALKAMALSGESLQVRLDKLLLAYRNAPHAFTGEMPVVRFMGRQLRTRLDSVNPDSRWENKRLGKQMERGSQNLRSFREGDMVWVRDYHEKDKWVPGTINKKCGSLTYQVTVSKGLWKRHIDQLS